MTESTDGGMPLGMIVLVGIMVLFMAATVWYFMPHEGEIIIQTGDSFGPYLYKGKISGGSVGVDTFIVEYNGTEFYYRSWDVVSINKDYQYRIRLPDGPGIIILKVKPSEDDPQ